MRSLGGVLFATLLGLAAPAGAQDTLLASSAAIELRQMCETDRATLWGADLCGPLIVVDPATRQAWATQPDQGGTFRFSGSGWSGTLPAGVPVANSTVAWDGVRWIMVMAPLPEDATERRVLIAHEAWHRAQESLGLPVRSVEAPHLETERGRLLMRLEFRALATAMRSRSTARRRAARDAIYFRNMRIAEFLNAGYAEASLDRNEGLASYTGVRLGAGDGAEADLFAARMLDRYDRHDALARSYAYASGPAYGLLLDEYRATWRAELGGNAPADVLNVIVRPDPYGPEIFDRLATRYGGEAIAAEERVRIQERAAQLAAYRAQYGAGPRLVLSVANMQMEFDPEQVTPIDGLGSVYQSLTVRDAWGVVRATEGALISSDFTRIVLANPAPDGLSGPGWALATSPGMRVLPPDQTGARTIVEAP
jgi:hypothetical protein